MANLQPPFAGTGRGMAKGYQIKCKPKPSKCMSACKSAKSANKCCILKTSSNSSRVIWYWYKFSWNDTNYVAVCIAVDKSIILPQHHFEGSSLSSVRNHWTALKYRVFHTRQGSINTLTNSNTWFYWQWKILLRIVLNPSWMAIQDMKSLKEKFLERFNLCRQT